MHFWKSASLLGHSEWGYIRVQLSSNYLLLIRESLNPYCLHLSGSFRYEFALSKNVEANHYGSFKPLLAQTVHISVKGAEGAVIFPLEDSRAPYICS